MPGNLRGDVLHGILKDYHDDENRLTDDERLICEHVEKICDENYEFFLQNNFICPITRSLLLDPVNLEDVDGSKSSQQAFEKSDIEEHLKRDQIKSTY